MKLRRRNLGNYRLKATKRESRSDYHYNIYDIPGKRTSVSRVATVLGKTPAQLRDRCEAYGRSVECYQSANSFAELEQLSAKLRAEGIKHKVQEFTDKNNGRLLIPVTYFKAWHWDE